MKVHDHTDRLQRRVLIGMIVNPRVLGTIASKWTGENFASSYANIVARLCVRYWEKHHDVPGKGIRSLYERWAEHNPHKDEEGEAGKFLSTLKDEFRLNGELNTNLIIDHAGEHFNAVRLERLRSGLESDLRSKRYDAAEEKLTAATKKIELGSTAGIDIFQDKAEMALALHRERLEPLIRFGQKPLDYFFRSRLIRGGFVAVLAPEKVGKTSMLVDLAIRAMLSRHKTAYFAIGDETKEELHERLMVRMSRIPFDAKQWPCETHWPTKIIMSPKGSAKTPKVRTKTMTFRTPLDVDKAFEAYEEVSRGDIHSKQSYLRTSCHGSSTIGVAGIESILDGWETNGFSPDCIFIDYADNLAHPPGRWDEKRDAINRNWQAMRAMSQVKGRLVITATQANRESYESRSLDRKHVSEDKRKLAHTTGVFAISATAAEKERGLARLSWAVARRGKWSSRRFIWIAGCWDLCCPCVVSAF